MDTATSPVLNVTRNSVAAVRMHGTLHHANILLLSQCQSLTFRTLSTNTVTTNSILYVKSAPF